MLHAQGRPAGAALTLAVGLACLALATAMVCGQYVSRTWIQRDGRFYVNVSTTLAEGLSVDQGEFAASWYSGTLGWNRNLDPAWSNVALGANGERLPKHPILLPLASLPLFWAFGLDGNLLFNLLMIALAGAMAFGVARRYASEPAAVLAALALPLGTGIRAYAYDFHVDVLHLALFFGGWAALHARRGWLAGALLGLCVVIRPTGMLWMPALAMTCVQARDWRTLLRTLGGGAVILALFALSNWGLYGRPWWSGYNRVLVVVEGEPQVADVSDAFSVPLRQGLTELWGGHYGIARHLTLVFFAAPGLVAMLKRRWLEVAVSLACIAGSVLLFAHYRWFGDRFLWPSAALLVPGLAVGLDLAGRGLSPAHRPWASAALLAGLVALANILAGAPLIDRFGLEPATLFLRVGLLALTCAALAWAGAARARGAASVIAPAIFLLFPGVIERALEGGPELYVASAITLAIAMPRWWLSLPLAALAGWLALVPTAVEPGTLVAALEHGEGRAVLVLIVLAALGLPFAGWYGLRLLPLLALLLPSVASLGAGRWPLFSIALLAIPAAILCARAAEATSGALRGLGRRELALGAVTVLIALAIGGATWRLSPRPWRIASYEGVRRADVRLGDIPCDFLAWEHLNWECATFDGGAHGETGLITSARMHVGGVERRMFLITTRMGRSRTVRWRTTAGSVLWLRFAVPDEARGAGRLTLRAWPAGTTAEQDAPRGSDELETFQLPDRPRGLVSERRFDTSALAGREVEVELELAGANAAVLVDGGFEEGP